MLMSMTGLRKRWISCFWSILNPLLQITKFGLDCECLGGGRIEHKEADKYIKVTFLFSSNCRIRVVLHLKLCLFRCTAIRWVSARLITRRALRSWRDGTLTTPSIGRMMATNEMIFCIELGTTCGSYMLRFSFLKCEDCASSKIILHFGINLLYFQRQMWWVGKKCRAAASKRSCWGEIKKTFTGFCVFQFS